MKRGNGKASSECVLSREPAPADAVRPSPGFSGREIASFYLQFHPQRPQALKLLAIFFGLSYHGNYCRGLYLFLAHGEILRRISEGSEITTLPVNHTPKAI